MKHLIQRSIAEGRFQPGLARAVSSSAVFFRPVFFRAVFFRAVFFRAVLEGARRTALPEKDGAPH